MFVKIALVLLQLALVRALLDGSLTSPSSSELLNMINQLKQTVSGLQQTVNNLQQTNTNSQHIISSLQQNVSNSQQTISTLQQTVNQLNQKINSDAAVDFSATLTQSKDHLGGDQVIVYDRVLTNDGSGYEPRTGHFTAPKAGSYMFTVSAMGHGGQLLSLNIVKNGVAVEEVYSASNSPYTVTTESIILHLDVNDMVWVAYYRGSGYIHCCNYNSFSGFLVK